jgi:hypothetical protein
MRENAGLRGHIRKLQNTLVPAWTLLLATSTALVTTCGWIWSVRPLEPVWGSIGEVLGGGGTALALLFTAFQIRAANRQRDQDKLEYREAMARAVSVSSTADDADHPGVWRIDYTIHNGSQFPLDGPLLLVVDVGAEEVSPGEQIGTATQLVLSTVHPGQTIHDHVDVGFTNDAEPAFGELTGLVSLIFTDAWDQTWLRGPCVLERRTYPARIC